MNKKLVYLTMACLLTWSCESKTKEIDYQFPDAKPIAKPTNSKLPLGLTIDTAIVNLGSNQIAFVVYATVDFSKNSKLRFVPTHSTTAKKPSAYLATFSNTSQKPYIATNGGYFWQGISLSLLVLDGAVKSIENPTVTRDAKTVYPVRSSFGQMADGSFKTTWIYCVGDDGNKPYSFPSALDNNEQTKTYMATAPTSKTTGASKWAAVNSIGGGPMLIKDSVNVAVANYWKEVFDGGGIAGTSRQPRTAIGVTNKGKLILMVIDGRDSNNSAGMTLSEVANFMMTLGVKQAINLDGGGSSVMATPYGLANKPSDSGNVERAVPTAVIIAEQL
jgi:hypothetical protein